MIIAGELRHNIVVKELVVTRDSNNGSTIETWTTKYNLKAKIVTRSGSKAIQNNEIFNSQTMVFNTYYRNIVDTDRIEHNGYDYKIMMLGEVGYKEGLEIICERINE